MGEWTHAPLAELRMLLDFVVACCLGALVGIERELRDRPAGIRTHLLVSGAACLLVSLGAAIVGDYEGTLGDAPLNADPTRVMEAVITGVSFIGAGTIIFQRNTGALRGLTTAATLLLAAAVGIAVALAHYLLAAGTVVLSLVAMRAFLAAERRMQIPTEPGAPDP